MSKMNSLYDDEYSDQMINDNKRELKEQRELVSADRIRENLSRHVRDHFATTFIYDHKKSNSVN